MKVNSGQAASTLIPEYIGSAFDKIVTVADNIKQIKDIAASIEGLVGSGYIGDTPPTEPSAGTTWYCTLDGRSYIWYEDTDSGQWVDVSPQSTADDPSIAGNFFTLWKRSAAAAGYNLVVGSFEEGGTLTSTTDVLWHKKTNSIYSWVGTYPANGYIVAPGTNPVGNTNYVSRTNIVPNTDGGSGTDALLRSDLTSAAGMSLIGVFSDVSSLRLATGLTPGRKIQLLGYYSDTPGIGGGTLIVTDDTASADNGGTVFITADGIRVKRERTLRLKASDFGARGDWNGTTGTNNKPFIEAMIAASNSSQPWEIDLNNVAVSSIVISSKNNWVGYITGSVIKMSAKPVAGASNQKDTASGALPTFKITSCDGWKIKGGSIDNRYREAFYVQFCSHFTNECDVLGSGLNDNLMPNYYRYCDNFTLKNFRHSATSAKPATGYYDWCNNLLFWDCSHFKIHNFTVSGTGSNGVYVGSNCNDFTISKFNILENAMSGIQVAWSSFGTFPYRFTITDGVINGNRADGIDINNTIGYASRIDCVIRDVLSTNNGYNTDGSVTPDGSGVGTFVWVTHFEVVNCHTIDPARTGFYARSCSDFNLTGGAIKKQKATNNVGGGVYLENCARFNIRDIDVAMYVTQEALKTYGAINTGKIGGTYNGIINLTPPSATTSYTDVMFLGASLYTANQMTTQFPLYNCRVYANGNALYVAHNIYETDVVSVTGSATTIGASRVSITGGTHRGGVNGISSTGYDNIKLDGVKGIADTTGTGIYINGGNKITMLHTHGVSTSGTGNSTKISNTTTLLTMIGNTYGTGIVEVNPATYTLKDF